MRHKHILVINENMMKINPVDYKEKKKDYKGLSSILNNNFHNENLQTLEPKSNNLLNFQQKQFNGDDSNSS